MAQAHNPDSLKFQLFVMCPVSIVLYNRCCTSEYYYLSKDFVFSVNSLEYLKFKMFLDNMKEILVYKLNEV